MNKITQRTLIFAAALALAACTQPMATPTAVGGTGSGGAGTNAPAAATP